MRSAHAFPPRDIEQVVVKSFPEAIAYPGCDHAGPYRTQLQAKMSIQFTVAAVLAHGRLDDEVFRGFAADGEVARSPGACGSRTTPSSRAGIRSGRARR